MKFTAAAVLSAVAVSATPVPASTPVFEVSDFSAGCIPHSSQCLYSFGVLQHGTMETTPVECRALVMAQPSGQLPPVTEAPCTDSSRTFNVVVGTDGLTLTVSQPVTPSSNQTGSHLLPACEFETSTQPNAEVQSYTGPTAFGLE